MLECRDCRVLECRVLECRVLECRYGGWRSAPVGQLLGPGGGDGAGRLRYVTVPAPLLYRGQHSDPGRHPDRYSNWYPR